MRINSIELENFRRYKEEIIEFPTGLIGIVGRNGVGKSTLVEALAWCLYGSDAARTKQDEIKRSQAKEREKCRVIIELTFESDALKIERILSGKNCTPSANLYLNGNPNPHVSGTTAVTDYITHRTKMDYVAFITSLFARQKDLDGLTGMTGSTRRKTILRLLRIDQIEDAIKMIKEDSKQNELQIQQIEKYIKDVSTLEEELQNMQTQAQIKQKSITINQEKVSTLKKSLEEHEHRFTILEEKYTKHQEINTKIEGLKGLIQGRKQEKITLTKKLDESLEAQKVLNKLKPKLDKFKKISKTKTELDSLKLKFTEKSSLETQLENCKNKISDIQIKISEFHESIKPHGDLDSKINLMNEELRKLEDEWDNQNQQKNQIDSKIFEKTSRKNELNAELIEIQELGDKSECPKCKRPLGDTVEKLVGIITQNIQSITNEIGSFTKEQKTILKHTDSIEKQITLKKQEKEGIEHQNQIKNNLLTKIEENTKVLKSCQNEEKTIQDNLFNFKEVNYNKTKHDEIISEFQKLEKIYQNSIALNEHVKQIDKLNSQIDSVDKNIDMSTKQLHSKNTELFTISFDETEYQKVKNKKHEANIEHQTHREDLIKEEQELLQIQNQIQQQENMIKEEKQKQEEIKKIYSTLQELTTLKKLMIDFKSDLMIRIKPQLAAKTSSLLKQITNSRYTSVDFDDDFTLKINDDGINHNIKRFSGGETDLVNLCLRIAISEELSQRSGGSGTQIIILDEIFGSQDEGRKASILQALHELTTKFRQILLITHVEDVKDALPYVLNITENPDNTVSVEEEGNLPLSH
ncbi:AAA family ATPase [Nitrosopumilus sp.]|uniref:AAA family ATPase n=1 Tax=Nitrosopumilus sp. TaxID=2024843 RepID=UPI003D14492E